MPLVHKLPQAGHHFQLLLAHHRPPERLEKLLAALILQRFPEQRIQQFVLCRRQPRAFQQLERPAGETQLILKAPDHFREKAVHRSQREPRQRPHHPFQGRAKIGRGQRQFLAQRRRSPLIAGGLGQFRKHGVGELAGRLAGESERHDLLRRHPARDQPDHPIAQLKRLPRSRRREDKQVLCQHIHAAQL